MEQFLQIGIVTKTHGVHGEVKVFPTTDDVRRFKGMKEVILRTKAGEQTLEPESARFFKNMVILKFRGIDRPEDCAPLLQGGLFVPRKDAVKLQKGEYFIADLLDMKVVREDGEPIGVLEDVMQTGANDVYVVRMEDGTELLLPAIKDCILEIDVELGVMKVHIMEGLL